MNNNTNSPPYETNDTGRVAVHTQAVPKAEPVLPNMGYPSEARPVYGEPATHVPMGQPVMGQPVMGQAVMGQPVMAQPVYVQSPVMGQPVYAQQPQTIYVDAYGNQVSPQQVVVVGAPVVISEREFAERAGKAVNGATFGFLVIGFIINLLGCFILPLTLFTYVGGSWSWILSLLAIIFYSIPLCKCQQAGLATTRYLLHTFISSLIAAIYLITSVIIDFAIYRIRQDSAALLLAFINIVAILFLALGGGRARIERKAILGVPRTGC